MRDDSDREDCKSTARKRSRSPTPAGTRGEVDKKASRLSKLQAWKQSKQVPASTSLETAVKKAQEAAAAVQAAKVEMLKQVAQRDVDPLDAFMETEILPEVRQKEEEERRQAEEDRKNLQELLSKGGKLPKSIQELIEDDEEPKPDMELQIPENKLKLVIGPGGERIKMIERQSKCRIQHAKASADLNRGFGTQVPLFGSNPGPPTGENSTERKKLITLQLFGNADACETARTMILEAMENKEQKAKQRAKEYEKKKESKRTERHIYHLRHARDYEALELPLGASKLDVKAAFRRLALKWHPDKNIGRHRLLFSISLIDHDIPIDFS